MPAFFLEEVEEQLAQRLGATTANTIVSSHRGILEQADPESAYRFVMALIPEVISRAGMMEGLALSQEVKDIYNRTFEPTSPQ